MMKYSKTLFDEVVHLHDLRREIETVVCAHHSGELSSSDAIARLVEIYWQVDGDLAHVTGH